MNNYPNKPDGTLNKDVAGSTTVLIEDYAAYGITEAEVEALDDANAEFGASIQLAVNQENLRRAAVAQKNAKRSTVVQGITEIAAKLYANPAVTDEMLTRAGFAPRPVRGGRTTPKTPTNFSAIAFGDGHVNLKWGRNLNSAATVFTVWSKAGNGPWTAVWSGTRTRVTIEGFSPSVTTLLRVTASVNNQTSTVSSTVQIFPALGMGTTVLEVAA